MAQHRRLNKTATRRIAAASAVVMGTTVLAPGVANAVEVTIPNTNISVNVPGLENVPNVEQFIPATPAAPAVQEVNNYVANVAAQAPAAAPAASSQGQAIANAVRSKIGAPYAWGATGPSAFDCSGLTTWAYQQVGKSIPRTSQAQAAQGQRVPLDQLQPGDIIAYYGGATHVGIYVGNGMIVDALNSGTPVGERPLHFQPIHSAVRF
ncbi:NlpC/P60 family protein [Corynebacterium pollutisoli]|uniref:NlpC/P60 family protein n=1 Tax=Corynebacterium pollutisoli TaxID=1610489 RepID=A0A1X7I3Q0_9CORY|nr:C40 family peptidase [Corynebacterium pollutisoli]SMG08826.1 NlpC/P60 family protein [Corynebacterium pollutisoli]